MPRPMKRSLFEVAARHASARPEFMGFLFTLYMRAHGLGPTEVAQELGCDQEALMRTSLCLRPREDVGRFRDDLRRIAALAGTNEDRLLMIVREAEAIEAVTGAAGRQAVMAAREHEDVPDNQGPDPAERQGQ